ncbi:ATPase [Massilia arenosa]|uniref:ATPase n=1 Tax=Zemynaea arenosa TaxID=2561931 RepID=A0A4Y9SGW9_9BURK|nr:SRPBCC family protein [Massilia arenosa]TFW20858.1 ATPase [Massilia arenosa]
MKKHTMELRVAGDREIVMTRTFDAPRALVFAAYTRPSLVQRWLGVHNGWTMPVCEIDLRVGGRYRYVWRGPDGMEMGMGGEFTEIVPGERLAATERFDQAWYDGAAHSVVTFDEQDGQTILTLSVQYDSAAVRDAVLKTPMEKGVAAGFNALEGLLASGTIAELAQGEPA